MKETYWQIEACFVIEKDNGTVYPKERVFKAKHKPTTKELNNFIDYMWENLGDVYVKSVDYTVYEVSFTEITSGMIRTGGK